MNIGDKAFYIRPNGKIEYAAVRQINGMAMQMSKNGLHEWTFDNRVYKTLGMALRAKRKAKQKYGECF